MKIFKAAGMVGRASHRGKGSLPIFESFFVFPCNSGTPIVKMFSARFTEPRPLGSDRGILVPPRVAVLVLFFVYGLKKARFYGCDPKVRR